MKRAASLTLSLLLLLTASTLTHAQTVSGRAPVVVPAQYTSSSSPMSDGRTVRTTYTAGSDQTVTVIAEPYRVPKGSAIQANSHDLSGWRTVEPRYVVAPTSTRAPASVGSTTSFARTAQPALPTASRLPVSTTVVPPTVVYYAQGTQGQVVQSPAGAASPPTTVYQVLGAETEATQPPVIQCPAPPVAAPTAVVPAHHANTIYKPILPLRRSIEGAYVSRGIWGQPKAYVPSEPVRNFFRYILP